MNEKKPLPILKSLEDAKATACITVKGGLTEREAAILKEIREAKARLTGASARESEQIRSRLAELKRLKEEARRERMQILGYEV